MKKTIAALKKCLLYPSDNDHYLGDSFSDSLRTTMRTTKNFARTTKNLSLRYFSYDYLSYHFGLMKSDPFFSHVHCPLSHDSDHAGCHLCAHLDCRSSCHASYALSSYLDYLVRIARMTIRMIGRSWMSASRRMSSCSRNPFVFCLRGDAG